MSDFWNQVVTTAILGTAKKNLDAKDLPADLSQWAVKSVLNADKETAFLNTAALAYNFRQCGTIPPTKADTQLAASPEESLAYCSPHMMKVLSQILDEDHMPLLELWLKECIKEHYLVHPQVLPALLDKAQQHSHLQALILGCGGQRATWLSQLNPDWHFTSASTDWEETWLSGKLEERKEVLSEIRKQDPNKGREWLEKVWPQENAASKVAFLKLLHETVSEQDLPWLETLLNEKGQKVREEAIELLKHFPHSSVMQLFVREAEKLVYVKQEKTMAIFSKQVLKMEKEAEVDEALFKLGIDKLSSDKKKNDTEWIAYQLLSFIPPSHWSTRWDITTDKIIELFNKDFPAYLDAFAASTLFHKDNDWAEALFLQSATVPTHLLKMVPMERREKYALSHVTKYPNEIVPALSEPGHEWSLNFTRHLFQHIAKEVYVFNKSYYRNFLLHIPVAILPELESFAPAEEHKKPYWKNIVTELSKLLELKKELTQ